MKTNLTLSAGKNLRVPLHKLIVMAIFMAALLTPSAFATSYFWDADGSGTAATGGSGTWDASSSLWRSGSGTGTLGTWPNTSVNTDTANLSGTAGTLTLNSSSVNINFNNITFGTTGYIIAVPGSGTATLVPSGTTPTIDTSTFSETINAVMSGSGSLTKIGSGTLTLGGANTFNGGMTVSNGSVVFSGPGSVANSTALNIGQATGSGNTASMTVTPTAAGTTTRSTNLVWSGNVTGGNNAHSFNVNGVAAGNTIENFGALTLNAGLLDGSVAPNAAANTRVVFDSVTRNPGTTMSFGRSSTQLGVNTIASQTVNAANVVFTTAPTLSGNGGTGTSISILPWADVANGPCTYDGSGNGLRALATAEKTALASGMSLGTSTAGQNASFAAITLAANTTVNCLTGGGTVGLGGFTLTVSSGFVDASTSVTIGSGVNDGTLALGQEGHLFIENTRSMTINSVITGTGGLTICLANFNASSANLVLAGANTFSGITTVMGNNNSLVAGLNNSLALQNSTLDYNNYGARIQFQNSLTAFTLGGLKGAQNLALANNAAAAVALTVGSAGDSDSTTYGGVLSGIGSIIKAGSGTLTWAGANTYSGNTTVSSGTLALSGSSSIANTPQINIASSATFNISGLTASGFALTGSGTVQTLAGGSTSGTASINAPSKTLTLNSGALLSFQAAGGNSSTVGKISVSGASANLTLNANAITVNVTGSSLVAGTYRLLDCTGTLTGSANSTPTITGTALSSGLTATISTTAGSAGHVDLVVKSTPAFSNLSANQSVSYGATSVTFSGTVSATGPVYPASGETITATINGNAQTTTINDATGDFSFSYNPSTIPASGTPYPITYSYAGNAVLNSASDATTTLTVNKATPVITWNNPADITYGTALDGTQLNATSGGVAGSFVYTPASGTVLNAGSGQTLSVQFTPTDTTDYNTPAAKTATINVSQVSTSVTLASSVNPSLPGVDVQFVAIVTSGVGTPTGTVLFKTNSTALGGTVTLAANGKGTNDTAMLPHGTNSVTAEYSGDVNYLPSTNSVSQVVNTPPLATTMTVTRSAGLSVKISLSDLATNWTDADGDTVVLAGINLVTTNLINLTTNSAWILYTNSPNVNDQFSYNISDGKGGTNSGLVNIVVAINITGQTTGLINSGGGAVTVLFAGIPTYSYSVQRTTNLTDWLTIWTTNAPGGGLFNYTDNFTDLGGIPPTSAYYRLSWNP